MFDRGYRSHYMGGQKEKFTRELASEKTWIFKWLQKSQGFQYSCTFYRLQEMDSTVSSMTYASSRTNKYAFNLKGLARTARSHDPSKYVRRGIEKGSEGLKTVGESVISEIIKAVVPTDLKVSGSCIFDPQDKSLQFWNRMFIISCILSVSIDPLFLYLPYANKNSNCIGIDENLAKTATTLRTIIDAFYLIRMVLQFRTAHIAPSSRVFGRGELVTDLSQIARRYLRRYFFVDLLAVLPLPQLVVWKHFHKTKNAEVYATKQALLILVILQYIPRFLRFIPLTSEVKKSAGVFAESALAGAAYYLLWYLLASHIVGAFWYLLAIERHDTCWMDACRSEPDKCKDEFLYCGKKHATGYEAWKKVSKDVLHRQCSIDDDEKDPPFNFGIYENVLKSGTISSNDFFSKFCYCLWWGLQNLSTLGQGLESSVYPGEVLFCIAVCIMGLILLAMLIGNMQTYLQSITVRLEEMRIKRRDSEQWMHHRYLPQELRERVRRYDQYKWLETRGVDEESLVQSLPKDLRRDIKRHLCLNLVRRVPLFANMDERLLDAICERLKPSLSTEGTYILREGDPVDKMLFTIRGSLESVTTDGGRSGFFNRGLLKDGDFCGEELLTWALDPKASSNLPLSTRTVRAMTEVEAFALEAEELKFVASQFRRLHSRQVQHTFRFYSQQWRTWAACFIQAAWRRHAKRKHLEFRFREEEEDEVDGENVGLLNRNDSVGLGNSSSKFGATIFASRFAAHALRGVQRFRTSGRSGNLVNLQKPPEPDFSADH